MSQAHNAAPDNAVTDPASAGEPASRVSEQVTTLVTSSRWPSWSCSRRGKRAGLGAGLFGGAAVFGWFGFGCLVAAAIAALAVVLPTWASALIVVGALLLIAGIAALIGKSKMQQAVPPAPTEAVAGVREDVQALKGHHR